MLMPIIGHVQVASAPKRQEPGTGELDDFYMFQKLDELGYRGYVGAEYRPAAGTLEGLGWWKRARAHPPKPKERATTRRRSRRGAPSREWGIVRLRFDE